jgi:hypothetical protein
MRGPCVAEHPQGCCCEHGDHGAKMAKGVAPRERLRLRQVRACRAASKTGCRVACQA